jgi:hypothetical protein
MVTNSLVGLRFLANSPATLLHSLVGTNVLFNLGTLVNGAVTNFSVRVQSTNQPTQLTQSASVGASGITDTNTANNTATNLLNVEAYASTNLMITLTSPQSFDSLDGLMEQTITISNAGPTPVESTRVIASGLSYQLFNAVGTNSGNPFVVHGGSLNTNETVSLILQYFVPTHKPVPVSLHAFGIPAYNLAPPAQLGLQVGTRILQMLPPGTSFPGCAAIVFDSVSNQTFTVIYSDDATFASNVFMAQPSVKAFANQTLWVDYGPPATISSPTNITSSTNVTMRFYQVFLNP